MFAALFLLVMTSWSSMDVKWSVDVAGRPPAPVPRRENNQHTIITNLERAGVSPRTAQTLARHSDIRLTMGIYTHIELGDQAAAIEALPGP